MENEENNVTEKSTVATTEVANVNDTSKQKKGNSILNKTICGFPMVGALPVLILVLALAVFITSKLFTNKTDIIEYPVVFVNSDDEVYVGTKNGKSNRIEKEDASAKIAYKNRNADKFLYINDDLYEVTAKNGEKEKIASDVRTAKYSDDDNYILYINDDDDLYSYKKDATKIAKEVDAIYAVVKGKVYYSKDGNLYVIKSSGKGDAEKIASDVTGFNVNDDKKTAVYLKSDKSGYELYTLKLSNNKSKKMASDIEEVVAYSDDYQEFIYTVEADKESFDLSKILDDDMKKEDEKYMDLYNGSGYGSMSYTEKYKKYDVDSRNKIREYVSDDEYDVETYDVYYVKNGKTKKLVSGVAEVLSAIPENKEVVYTKETLDTSKKLKISDYTSSYRFETDVKKLLTTDLYYSKNGKKEVEVVSDAQDISAYLTDKGQLYYTVEDDNEYTLYYGKVGRKIDAKEIDNDLKSSSLTEFKDGFLYGVDYSVTSSSYDLKFVKNGKAEKIASDVYGRNSIMLSNNENRAYFYNDFDDGEGDFSVFNGSKVKTILEDISSVYYLNDNYMYVMSDCNSKRQCDLGVYTGSKKIKKISSDVKEIVSYK